MLLSHTDVYLSLSLSDSLSLPLSLKSNEKNVSGEDKTKIKNKINKRILG